MKPAAFSIILCFHLALGDSGSDGGTAAVVDGRLNSDNNQSHALGDGARFLKFGLGFRCNNRCRKAFKRNWVSGCKRRKSCMPFCFNRKAAVKYKKWTTEVQGKRYFCTAPSSDMCIDVPGGRWDECPNDNCIGEEETGQKPVIIKKPPKWTMVDGDKQYECYNDAVWKCPNQEGGVWRPRILQTALDYFKGAWWSCKKGDAKYYCNGGLESCPQIIGAEDWKKIEGAAIDIWKNIITALKPIVHRKFEMFKRKLKDKAKCFCMANNLGDCKFDGDGQDDWEKVKGDEKEVWTPPKKAEGGVSMGSDDEDDEKKSDDDDDEKKSVDEDDKKKSVDQKSVDVTPDTNKLWETKVGNNSLYCQGSDVRSCPRFDEWKWKIVKGIGRGLLGVVDMLINKIGRFIRLSWKPRGGCNGGCGVVYCRPFSSFRQCPRLF